ncbi:CRE-SUCH-1 protein [Caenorhabditis remanei]|uniref:CRE-SUCH-1 protein n=2 Tax=Caenorhabditis remanei TaxID=31234 RepID=E3MID0_CAERE|nr:CRE-SUCH-1 protein [Caenorhabditis remanei]
MPLVKTGPNLDAIFNHQLTNVTGEPLTPTKISIFYLVRTLFHAHFGVGAVPSLKPFNKAEKTKAFSILYGLILSDSEISYDDFRRVVRMLDNDLGRCIYYNFICSIEKLAYGDEQIEMLFENAFYTAKRPTHIKVFKQEQADQDNLTFMSNNSFMYTWIKRVMMQYTRTSQEGMFIITERFRDWVLSGNIENVSPINQGINMTLPFEINCSVRARKWIDDQLRFIQFCQSKAMPHETILDLCDIISKRHRDVFEVNLLKTVVHIQLKNPPEAMKSLKVFFDLSMLQITDSARQALNTLKLMSPSQIALRYGPVLQGRLHRIFGDRKCASELFSESIQQSQVNVDDMCNRIANLELTINEVLMSGPILERLPSDRTKAKKQDDYGNETNERRVLQNTIHAAANINIPNIRALQKDFNEDYDLHTFLVSMSKFMLCIEDMMDGKYFKYNSTAEYVCVGFNHLRLIYDSQNKGRAIEDFANAIMSSGLIQSGMYNQARRAAEEILMTNCTTPSCPKLETESQAVSGVNLAYSLASIGDYDNAFKTINSLNTLFPEQLSWISARHVKICFQLIQFERDFLLNRYTACSDHLKEIGSLAPLEYTLRKSLLLAVTGKLSEAVNLLKEYKCVDVRGLLRIHMQLATIEAAYGRFDVSEYHLEEAGNIAVNTHFQDARFLVTRRFGSMILGRNMPEEAFKVLMPLYPNVERFGTFIEKAIYFMSVARCLRLLKKDPRIFLKKCKLQILNDRWPSMEKLLCSELTILHHKTGMFPDENKATWAMERFGKIEVDFPGPCVWIFI